MRHGRWGRTAAAFVIAAAAALLGGCGQSTPVLAGDLGTNAQVGDVLLRDVRMVEPLTSASASDGSPTVFLSLINKADQPDALTGVATDVATRVEIRVDPDCDGRAETVTRLELPAQVDRTSSPAAGGYVLRLVDLRVGILQGASIPITFTFMHAGTVTVPIPVETGSGGASSGGASQPAGPCATPGAG